MVNISLILSMDGGVLETSAVDNPQTQPWNSSVLMQLLPMLWWCQRRNLHTPQRNGNSNRHGRTFEVCVTYQLFSAQPTKKPFWKNPYINPRRDMELIARNCMCWIWYQLKYEQDFGTTTPDTGAGGCIRLQLCTISLMLITLPGSNGSLLKIGLGPKGKLQ